MGDSIVMEGKKISEINRFGVTTSDTIKIGRVPSISEVAARVIAPFRLIKNATMLFRGSSKTIKKLRQARLLLSPLSPFFFSYFSYCWLLTGAAGCLAGAGYILIVAKYFARITHVRNVLCTRSLHDPFPGSIFAATFSGSWRNANGLPSVFSI